MGARAEAEISLDPGFADGRSVSLFDSRKSWGELRRRFAYSNGCYKPKKYRNEVKEMLLIKAAEIMAKEADQSTAPKVNKIKIPKIKNKEIDKTAATIYYRQNFVFTSMAAYAGKIKNLPLWVDMTQIYHPRPQDIHIEKNRVPKSFSEGGQAKRLARDEAFFIAEKIAKALGYAEPTPAQLKKYNRLMNILHNQVEVSANMQELHTNFFAEVRRQKQ